MSITFYQPFLLNYPLFAVKHSAATINWGNTKSNTVAIKTNFISTVANFRAFLICFLLFINSGFRRCHLQQQRWNSYFVEIRTECSICQCMGPLKVPENLMSTHSFACTDIFSAVWGYIQEKDICIIKPAFCPNKTASHSCFCRRWPVENVKSSQMFPCKTKYSVNKNGQELVFLDDLCISGYFYLQLLFGTLTCDLLGSYWILERGKEH